MATVIGGVGGLLSPESTAQALSVTAATVTGVQSTLNQNYYREKTFEIITKAIDVRRKSLWANIEAKRIRHIEDDNYNYVINEAITDMIAYNNACSVIAGFEELANSVKEKEKQIGKITAGQKEGADKDTMSVEELMASQE